VQSAIEYRISSSTSGTAIVRVAALRPGRRSSRSPASRVRSSRSSRAHAICSSWATIFSTTPLRACGSFLFSVVRGGAYVHVGMGSLIDVPAIRPTAHIFVGSMAPWFEITDDLPQFEEYAS
jgi:hypothetical protein